MSVLWEIWLKNNSVLFFSHCALGVACMNNMCATSWFALFCLHVIRSEQKHRLHVAHMRLTCRVVSAVTHISQQKNWKNDLFMVKRTSHLQHHTFHFSFSVDIRRLCHVHGIINISRRVTFFLRFSQILSFWTKIKIVSSLLLMAIIKGKWEEKARTRQTCSCSSEEDAHALLMLEQRVPRGNDSRLKPSAAFYLQ